MAMINNMHMPLKDYTYVVIDLETTGLTRFDRVCEIGMTKVIKNRIVDKFETLINPQVAITNTYFHGIEDWMVKGAPVFKDAAWQVAEFIKGAVLIAHNAPFDMRFMRYELQRLGTDLSHYALCTLKLARRLHPEFPYHRLDYLLGEYNLVNDWPHRAGTDAYCEARLFLGMKRILEENRLETMEALKIWGLPYDHRWCSKINVSRRANKTKLLTRDDLL
jgi:DNA polymerase-3 subunit epsilon